MKKYTCTACSYVYNPFTGEEGIKPGTFFEDIDESWRCPHCHESKDFFIELPENIQELSLTRSTEQELSHTPFYREDSDSIIVQVGTEDYPHPNDEGHCIEYIGLFDEDGEPLDIHVRPETNSVIFSNEYLDRFEIRASCNLHGIWRGKNINN